MDRIRAGKGLGDALYLQGVVRHLVERGDRLEVVTPWPDVFRPLAGRIMVSPFRRNGIDKVAHYIERKNVPGTDQFVDCCISAGVTERIEFRLDWAPTNEALVGQIKSAGKPVVIVQMPREPMGRSDGFGMDLLPDSRAMQAALDAIGDRAFKVQVGRGDPLFRLEGLDLDLVNGTSPTELIDVAWAADAALGYCSFIAPLAESLRKPLLLVWSTKGSRSSNPFIRSITPSKILHRSTNRAVMDDCSSSQMVEAVDALLGQV